MNLELRRYREIALVTFLCVLALPAAAQDRPFDEPNPPWKAELSKLPTPRAANGKPDLNGVWLKARHWVEARLGPNNVQGDRLGMRVDADVSEGGEAQRQIQIVRGNFAWNERDMPGGPATPRWKPIRIACCKSG